MDKNFETFLKKSVDEAIKPLMEKQDKIQKTNETRFSAIEKHLSNINQILTKPTVVNHLSSFPPLPLQHQPVQSFTNSPSATPGSVPTNHPPGDQRQAATRNIIARASRVAGLSSITKADNQKLDAPIEAEGLTRAAVDLIRNELGVKEGEIKESDVIRVFIPLRSDKDNEVYVEFRTKAQANLCPVHSK